MHADEVQKLRETLTTLHAELGTVESGDPEVRAMLISALEDIATKLEARADTTADTTIVPEPVATTELAEAAHSSASFGAEKCPSAFVFQVSEREPALRVEYPAPLNAVAAFSALSPAEKLNRTGWWGLAMLFKTFFDPDYAKRLQK